MTTEGTTDGGDSDWCESRSDVGARCCFLKGRPQPHATLIAADEVRAIAIAYGEQKRREALREAAEHQCHLYLCGAANLLAEAKSEVTT